MVNEYRETGIPFLRSQNVRPFRFDPAELKFISPDFHAKLRKSALRPNDVVVTRSGANTGQCCIIPPYLTDANCSDLVILRPSKRINPWFLMYVLNSDWGRATIAGGVVGAAQHHFNIGVAKQFSVLLPALPLQHRIAGILSAYDELIENCDRRARVLEEIARSMYRDIISDGAAKPVAFASMPYWTFITENIAPYEETKRYYATADVVGLNIQGKGIDYTFSERPSRAQKSPEVFSVWFARMKDTYKIAWFSDLNRAVANRSILSSGFAGFRASEPQFFPLLFLAVSSSEFHTQKDRFCTGATQMSLTNEGLARIEMPLLTQRLARQLGTQCLPILNEMLVLQMKVENLRRTRDLLLPRLLSGQVPLDASGVEGVAEPTAPAPPLSQTDLTSEEPALRAAEDTPPYRVERKGRLEAKTHI
jgi:type I restriction enzyme S subunit